MGQKRWAPSRQPSLSASPWDWLQSAGASWLTAFSLNLRVPPGCGYPSIRGSPNFIWKAGGAGGRPRGASEGSSHSSVDAGKSPRSGEVWHLPPPGLRNRKDRLATSEMSFNWLSGNQKTAGCNEEMRNRFRINLPTILDRAPPFRAGHEEEVSSFGDSHCTLRSSSTWTRVRVINQTLSWGSFRPGRS
jgi:hypothetical protein